MTDSINAILTGLVANPRTLAQADASTPQLIMGRQGDNLVSELHGKYYQINYRRGLFSANVTAVTIPVIASGLVSVFSLYNPVGSGINMSLIDLDIGQVLATTVVDTVGLYFSTGTVAAAATFTTEGSARSGVIGESAMNVGKFYTALTHSGTPTRFRMVGAFGAVTDAGMTLPHFEFDGKVIIPPGCIVSVAMSTAAGVSSGLDIGATWAEWPI